MAGHKRKPRFGANQECDRQFSVIHPLSQTKEFEWNPVEKGGVGTEIERVRRIVDKKIGKRKDLVYHKSIRNNERIKWNFKISWRSDLGSGGKSV